METIRQFVLHSVEMRAVGWNLVTFGWIGASLITLLQTWGVLAQARTIFRKKTGDGVSIANSAFYALNFMSFFVYGLAEMKLNIVTNAFFVGGAMCAVLYGLLCHGFWTRRDVILFVLFLFLPCTMAYAVSVDWGQEFFGVTCVFSIVLLCVQYRELHLSPSAEGFNVRPTQTFLVACIFWFLYAIADGKDPYLIGVNLIAGMIFAATWLLYRRKLREKIVCACDG